MYFPSYSIYIYIYILLIIKTIFIENKLPKQQRILQQHRIQPVDMPEKTYSILCSKLNLNYIIYREVKKIVKSKVKYTITREIENP